ncbi:fimbrial protein [Dyella silvae]|uniref:fimbrial protein n=1 Tax=Dyella silvae TaxID=2994424 RepID=UPI002264C0A0|nr:fimbrial protein [Dyella silvae]
MKRKSFYGLLTSMLLVAASPGHAQSVTFNLTGNITQGTCNFTIPDGDLGTHPVSWFTGSRVTAWSNPIVIKAVSCSPDIQNIRMTFIGTPDTSNGSYFAPVSTSGNVTGVAIELGQAGPLLTAGINPGSSLDWPLGTLGNSYSIHARFTQTKPSVTPGVVKTPITVQFTYY